MSKHCYGSLKVADLKDELRKRGAKVCGTKEKLIERLQDYDRNNNFQPLEVNKLQASLQSSTNWPENYLYFSVNSKTNVPDLDIVYVNTYFLEPYKDNLGLSEYAAVHRKAYNMLMNEYLLALVTAVKDSYMFFKGQVHSENTKSLTYFVQVAFLANGDIIQSECECVSGKGPKAVCKHVAVICYAILRFRENSEWNIKKTPTERKQVWHEPKRIKLNLSPKKASDLSFEIQEYRGHKRIKINMNYNPRPKFQRPSTTEWRDSVNNKVINFSCWKKICLGMSGVLEVASITGIKNDHDYLKMPLHHQFVINKITVSSKDAKNIEKQTRNQSQSKVWHFECSLRVTASKVGEICKSTERKNKEKFAECLVFPKEIHNQALQWGKAKEETAIEAYELMSLNKVERCGFVVLPKYPFIGASPDGLIGDQAVLEIKCPFSIKDSCITPENYSHVEYLNGILQLKENSSYYYQIQTQLLVSERSIGEFFIWTNVDEKRIFVYRNDYMINNVIIPIVTEFFYTYMLPVLTQKFYGVN